MNCTICAHLCATVHIYIYVCMYIVHVQLTLTVQFLLYSVGEEADILNSSGR